jgi:hypothetical protein
MQKPADMSNDSDDEGDEVIDYTKGSLNRYQ